jgi:hypothetical protein
MVAKIEAAGAPSESATALGRPHHNVLTVLRLLIQTPLTSSSDLGLVNSQLIADGSQSYM